MRSSVKADTTVAAKIEVKGDGEKVITNIDDLPRILEGMLSVETITCSLSVSRKTTGGASNNYFQSTSIGGIGKIYTIDFEGVDKAEIRKALGQVLVKRVGNTFDFIRSCIKKEHEKDGMPIFNLGQFLNAK